MHEIIPRHNYIHILRAHFFNYLFTMYIIITILRTKRKKDRKKPYPGSFPLELKWRRLMVEDGGLSRGELGILPQLTAFQARTLDTLVLAHHVLQQSKEQLKLKVCHLLLEYSSKNIYVLEFYMRRCKRRLLLSRLKVNPSSL